VLSFVQRLLPIMLFVGLLRTINPVIKVNDYHTVLYLTPPAPLHPISDKPKTF